MLGKLTLNQTDVFAEIIHHVFLKTMLTYQLFPDNELLALLKSDDEKAFTEIYERYHSILYIYAHKKLENNLEAKDIVQDVLMNIWNKRYTLAITATLRSYLFTAVRNRILDIFAHQKVEEKYIDSLNNLIYTSSPSDYKIREKEISAMIEQEINALPKRMREIFTLSRKEWLTNGEIATKLDISPHTVETQMKRALRQLRLKLGHITHLLIHLIPVLLVLY